jgi:hypothetical protein
MDSSPVVKKSKVRFCLIRVITGIFPRIPESRFRRHFDHFDGFSFVMHHHCSSISRNECDFIIFRTRLQVKKFLRVHVVIVEPSDLMMLESFDLKHLFFNDFQMHQAFSIFPTVFSCLISQCQHLDLLFYFINPISLIVCFLRTSSHQLLIVMDNHYLPACHF